MGHRAIREKASNESYCIPQFSLQSDKYTLPSVVQIEGLSRLIYHKRLHKALVWPLTGGSDFLLGQSQGGPTKT